MLCSIHSVVDVEGGGAGDGQCEVGDPRKCVHPGWPGGGTHHHLAGSLQQCLRYFPDSRNESESQSILFSSLY